MQTAVISYLVSKQLLLFSFACQSCTIRDDIAYVMICLRDLSVVYKVNSEAVSCAKIFFMNSNLEVAVRELKRETTVINK